PPPPLSTLSLHDALPIFTIQRAQFADQLTTAKQQLAVAQEVELGQQVTFAAATKTTAKSRRNTVIVAALLGLLLGIFAALLWERSEEHTSELQSRGHLVC